MVSSVKATNYLVEVRLWPSYRNDDCIRITDIAPVRQPDTGIGDEQPDSV